MYRLLLHCLEWMNNAPFLLISSIIIYLDFVRYLMGILMNSSRYILKHRTLQNNLKPPEMSHNYPKPPTFISKLSKTAHYCRNSHQPKVVPRALQICQAQFSPKIQKYFNFNESQHNEQLNDVYFQWCYWKVKIFNLDSVQYLRPNLVPELALGQFKVVSTRFMVLHVSIFTIVDTQLFVVSNYSKQKGRRGLNFPGTLSNC